MSDIKNVPELRFSEFDGQWKLSTIEKSIDLLSGYAFKGDDISEDTSGIPLLRGINITEGVLRHNHDIDRFYCGSTEGLEKYFLKAHDLVLGMDGSKVGKNVAFITEKDKGSLLIQRVARLREVKGYPLQFIYHHIYSPLFHRYVDIVNTSSGIPHISAKQIKEFKIFFPPSENEQQKIADFLSSVDKKVEQLTEKHRLLTEYKKGVMQQIFTQQIRFKDDNGNDYPEWRNVSFEDVGSFYYGKSAPKWSVTEDAKTPCIRYGELYSKFDIVVDAPKSFTNIEPKNLKFSRGGEVLIPRVGEDPLDFASASFLPISGVAIGEMISVLNTNDNGLFLTYLINQRMKKPFARVVEGGNVSNLYFKYLKNIKFEIPCLEEQEKIAKFLTEIDQKIDQAWSTLEQTKAFKKGLLQKMFV